MVNDRQNAMKVLSDMIAHRERIISMSKYAHLQATEVHKAELKALKLALEALKAEK